MVLRRGFWTAAGDARLAACSLAAALSLGKKRNGR